MSVYSWHLLNPPNLFIGLQKADLNFGDQRKE